MSSTTYTDFQGPAVNAAWLNDVNTATYKTIVNVKSAAFGAKGDGVTDDTAAIQAAVNFAGTQPHGGTVFLPDGQYFTTATISIGSNFVTIVGSSKDAVAMVRTGAFGPTFSFTTGTATPLDGIGLANLRINDSGASNTTGTGVSVNNAARFTLDNVTQEGGTNGVLLLGVSNVYLSRYDLYALGGASAGRYGIQVGVSTNTGSNTWGSNINLTDIHIVGGDAVSGTISYLESCLYITGCDGLFGKGVYLGGGAVADLRVHSTVAGVVCGNILFDASSVCDICRGAGILLDGTQQVQKFQYNGLVDCNLVGQPAQDGASITGSVSNLKLSGMFRGWSANGIHLGTTVVGAVVSGMRGTGNGSYGVQVDSGARNFSIVGNELSNNTAGPLLDNSGNVTKSIAKNSGYNPLPATALTVTGSPFTFLNTTGDTLSVFIEGGAVSNVTVGGNTVASATNIQAVVPNGFPLVVTYSSAPTMSYIGT